jgi:ATP-dependent Clp protease ATP-binding subunit ClpA
LAIFLGKVLVKWESWGWRPSVSWRAVWRPARSEIQDPLAKQILSGAFAEGDTILIDYNGSEITFSQNN